jgi:hypothetical protein
VEWLFSEGPDAGRNFRHPPIVGTQPSGTMYSTT